MLKPHGYATVSDPDRPLVEFDTVTCAHCSAVVHVKPGTGATAYLVWSSRQQQWVETPGAGCYACGYAPVCLRCEADGRCAPLEQRLAQMERAR